MKNLEVYIIEKLKINKDTKLLGTLDYELLGNILIMCGWWSGQKLSTEELTNKIKEKEKDPLISGISKWIVDNKVDNVLPYADYENLAAWGEDDKVIEKLIDDKFLIKEYTKKFVEDRQFTIAVDGDDKSTQYEIYFNSTALLFRESDNGEFWATRLFKKD